MLEKETVKLEDSLTAMIRITKENEEIDRKTEIEKIKQQAKKEVQQFTIFRCGTDSCGSHRSSSVVGGSVVDE